MRIAWILGRTCKAAIVGFAKEIDERVAGLAVIDAIQPELLDEPVLQRLVSPLM